MAIRDKAGLFDDEDNDVINQIRTLWKDMQSGGPYDAEELAIAAYRLMFISGAWKNGTAEVLESAKYDPLAYDAILRQIKKIDEKGERLPAELQHFVVQVAYGKRRRPTRKNVHPIHNKWRDNLICEMIKQLNEGGYSIAQSMAIIKEATGKGEAAIKSIWYNRYREPDHEGPIR